MIHIYIYDICKYMIYVYIYMTYIYNNIDIDGVFLQFMTFWNLPTWTATGKGQWINKDQVPGEIALWHVHSSGRRSTFRDGCGIWDWGDWGCLAHLESWRKTYVGDAGFAMYSLCGCAERVSLWPRFKRCHLCRCLLQRCERSFPMHFGDQFIGSIFCGDIPLHRPEK